jgi:diguanylate cyclase (GGDEF)-like protein
MARPVVFQLALKIANFAHRPELLAFLPALTLAAFWIGGDVWLVITALGVPIAYGIAGLVGQTPPPAPPPLPESVDTSHILMRSAIEACLQSQLATHPSVDEIAILVVIIDDSEILTERHGQTALQELVQHTAKRISGALRDGDVLARLDSDCFALALAPQRCNACEMTSQIAERLQAICAPPITVDGISVYVTLSIGVCLGGDAPQPNGTVLLECAETAARHAKRQGPKAIRRFRAGMKSDKIKLAEAYETLSSALKRGEIQAFFQPQVDAETLQISGMEALARWQKPMQGLIPPSEFLPWLHNAGLSEQLTKAMIDQALNALTIWDGLGLNVPTVALNLSTLELQNPVLADLVLWELDRQNLRPERLVLEILESVAASSDDDIMVRNIARLAEAGCGIDLDDFGTGHASIANIRRFAVGRIKIDRSFVTGVADDPKQHQLVDAVISMASRLDLSTVAEGVETAAEIAAVRALGCKHLQGFGIARPMSIKNSIPWLTDYLPEQIFANAPQDKPATAPKTNKLLPLSASPPQ